jgi:ribose transport system substrate-binding protein
MNGITQSDPVYGDGLKAAAAVLGWSVEVVNSGTTPESENAAMQQAIQQHVGAIMFPGGDTAVLGSSLALAKQAKIPVFFSNSNQRATGADGNGVYGSLLTGDDVNAMAKLETNWAWADSGGKLKTLGVVVIPSLQTTVSEAAQVKETLGQLCPSCKVKELDAQYTDIGTNIPSQVVAAVRQDPSISYVLFTFGALTTGVSAALKGAGLSAKVKLAGISPNAANLQALVDGTEAMWVVEDKHLIGWRWADSYARFLVGDDVSVENSTLMPNQIMVKDNIQPGDITNYVVDAPYPDTFKALWKK